MGADLELVLSLRAAVRVLPSSDGPRPAHAACGWRCRVAVSFKMTPAVSLRLDHPGNRAVSGPRISVVSRFAASWDLQRDMAADRDRLGIAQSFYAVSVDLRPMSMRSRIIDSLHDGQKLQFPDKSRREVRQSSKVSPSP